MTWPRGSARCTRRTSCPNWPGWRASRALEGRGLLARLLAVRGRVIRLGRALRHGRGHPGPGTFQPFGADGGQPLAPLPEVQRLLEGEPAGLEPLDHPGELVARLLVGQGLIHTPN